MGGSVTPAASSAGTSLQQFANVSGDAGTTLLGLGAQQAQAQAFQAGVTALNMQGTMASSALNFMNESIGQMGRASEHVSKLSNQVAA